MATFTINDEYTDKRDIEAASFAEQNSFVVFFDSTKKQVYAVKTSEVHTITKKSDS